MPSTHGKRRLLQNLHCARGRSSLLSQRLVRNCAWFLAVMLCYASVQSCGSTSRENDAGRPSGLNTAEKLAGTRWRLVEIQSMDDAIGTARPSDRDLYTMDLNVDGNAAMRLNCN